MSVRLRLAHAGLLCFQPSRGESDKNIFTCATSTSSFQHSFSSALKTFIHQTLTAFSVKNRISRQDKKPLLCSKGLKKEQLQDAGRCIQTATRIRIITGSVMGIRLSKHQKGSQVIGSSAAPRVAEAWRESGVLCVLHVCG